MDDFLNAMGNLFWPVVVMLAGVIGWLVNSLSGFSAKDKAAQWAAIEELRRERDQQTEKIHALEMKIAEGYVTRGEMMEFETKLFARLDAAIARPRAGGGA